LSKNYALSFGLSKKYCHPEFISASIEHRHAELVSASLVQERFRVKPGMTAAGSE
jgi:hypothetical protein